MSEKESIGRKYLPIGTVVMLKGGKKRVMIIGFCAMERETKGMVWDYTGCIYPEGLIKSDQIFLFNHEQIETVYHLGLKEDEEEKAFKRELRKIMRKAKKEEDESEEAKEDNDDEPIETEDDSEETEE